MLTLVNRMHSTSQHGGDMTAWQMRLTETMQSMRSDATTSTDLAPSVLEVAVLRTFAICRQAGRSAPAQ